MFQLMSGSHEQLYKVERLLWSRTNNENGWQLECFLITVRSVDEGHVGVLFDSQLLDQWCSGVSRHR